MKTKQRQADIYKAIDCPKKKIRDKEQRDVNEFFEWHLEKRIASRG